MAAALVLVAAVAVFRLIGPLVGGPVSLVLANVTPLAAVVVIGAIYLPRRLAFVVPFGALFISTLTVNWAKGWPMLSPYTLSVALCFVVVFGLAWLLRGNPRVVAVLGMTVAGSLVFYLLSNSVAWVFEPGYGRSPAGWLQAQTIGLPIAGAPPAWWFLLKSLGGDLLFAAVMMAWCRAKPAATRPILGSSPSRPLPTHT